jgi:hypothetical protein
LIAIFYADIVISPSNIKLGEPSFLDKFVDYGGYAREGICVWNGELVKISIILDWSLLCVLLSYEKEGAGIRGFGPSDVTFLKVLV